MSLVPAACIAKAAKVPVLLTALALMLTAAPVLALGSGGGGARLTALPAVLRQARGPAEGGTATQNQVARSGVLVELFTSEGCSSCPPADELLRQLNGTAAPGGMQSGGGDGPLIIGLSEHVTYWNRLGWTDPFSAEAYTQRQQAYGRRFQLESVYTPQAVIDGEYEVVGSDREALLAAVAQSARGGARAGSAQKNGTQTGRQQASAMQAGGPLLRIVFTRISGQTSAPVLHLRYAVAGGASARAAGAALVFAAIAADAVPSHVLRGENAGRTLNHVAVVRSLRSLGAVRASGGGGLGSNDPDERSVEIPLDPETARNGTLHLVLFAQSAELGPVLSVTTIPLQP
jgi:hypothetical protein